MNQGLLRGEMRSCHAAIFQHALSLGCPGAPSVLPLLLLLLLKRNMFRFGGSGGIEYRLAGGWALHAILL